MAVKKKTGVARRPKVNVRFHYASAFGAEMETILGSRKMDQSSIAKRLRVGVSYFNQMMVGKTAITPKRVAQIAETLGLGKFDAARLQRAAALDRGYDFSLLIGAID